MLRHINFPLVLAGGSVELTLVAVGDAVAAAHGGAGLSTALQALTLFLHTPGTKATDGVATHFCITHTHAHTHTLKNIYIELTLK